MHIWLKSNIYCGQGSKRSKSLKIAVQIVLRSPINNCYSLAFVEHMNLNSIKNE